MTDDNAVVPAQPRAVGEFKGPRTHLLGGMEGFTPQQLGLRALEARIIHKISKQGDLGRPGQIRIGNEFYDGLTFVPLRASPFRSLVEGEGDDKKTTCVSADGWKPHPDVSAPKAVACVRPAGDGNLPVCHYARWSDLPTGKRKPPPCVESGAILGVLPLANDLPFWFPFKSISASIPLRQFLRDVNYVPGAQHLCQLQVTITTKYMNNGGVSWYVPEFSIKTLPDGQPDLLPIDRYLGYAQAVRDAVYTPWMNLRDDADDDVPPGEVIDTTATQVVPEDDDIPF